jgi:hypothetical protein
MQWVKIKCAEPPDKADNEEKCGLKVRLADLLPISVCLFPPRAVSEVSVYKPDKDLIPNKTAT